MQEMVLNPTDFVAFLNQTLETAYPSVIIQGELANFRVSKNRWVYFDLKDEYSSVKFFGTIYQLPGPLEDGLMLQVRGNPRLHPQYGFSVTVQTIQPVGEGSLKRAAALLEAKLATEGLFDPARKRSLPYPPKRVGLIASGESAAYHDFMKILNARWGGVEILHADVQVQGEAAPSQIIAALDHLNTHQDVDVIIMTRGGGSPEDMAAFSTEQVTRAVAASRTPTLVAIGHEVDVCLAELAADKRASTPSNAAELLAPDKHQVLSQLLTLKTQFKQTLERHVLRKIERLQDTKQRLHDSLARRLELAKHQLARQKELLGALSPQSALNRGYAIIRRQGVVVRSVKSIKTGDTLEVTLSDGMIKAKAD